ncbi:kinase-like protein [Serendipita vermifera]|nr:kinase-like protein [Serendipita vermifera]
MDNEKWESLPNLSGELAPISMRSRRMRGGYADVYEGDWKGQKVAVKVIMPVNHLQSMRRKVRREAIIWLRLDHPNILPLFGFADDEDFQPFGAFISPWCNNGNSEQYLEQHGESLDFDLPEGVGYLHSRDPPLIHGDIKPANILIDHLGIPKLCDFGLSRILHEGTSSGLTTTTAHTGTARYLAIELVISSENVSTSLESDIWALGCVGLKFVFSLDPYANRPHNLHGQIFDDIRNGIPPGRFSEYSDSDYSCTAWLLERCWNQAPTDRPNASRLLAHIFELFPVQIGKSSFKDPTAPEKMKFTEAESGIHTPVSSSLKDSELRNQDGQLALTPRSDPNPQATTTPSPMKNVQQEFSARLQKYHLRGHFSLEYDGPEHAHEWRCTCYVGSYTVGRSGWYTHQRPAREEAVGHALEWFDWNGYP